VSKAAARSRPIYLVSDDSDPSGYADKIAVLPFHDTDYVSRQLRTLQPEKQQWHAYSLQLCLQLACLRDSTAAQPTQKNDCRMRERSVWTERKTGHAPACARPVRKSANDYFGD
jgi:hypothetical protein